MLEFVRLWFQRNFSDPRLVALTWSALLTLATAFVLARWVTPVAAGLVVAYLLDEVVSRLERRGLRRAWGVPAVFLGGVGLSVALSLLMLPILFRQSVRLVRELPAILAAGRVQIELFSMRYPGVLSPSQTQRFLDGLTGELADLSQRVATETVVALPGMVTIVMYAVLVPLVVFYMLKDKNELKGWVARMRPDNDALVVRVWNEVDRQLGNYIRGKIIELGLLALLSWLAFAALDLEFALLLGVLVGLSVLVPYIGATLVTIPVTVVAYYQFGWSTELLTALSVYLVVQALDAVVLIPVLFERVIDLHPVATVAAIAFFGSVLGFWGVFFAIPIAVAVKALIGAWPRRVVKPDGDATFM